VLVLVLVILEVAKLSEKDSKDLLFFCLDQVFGVGVLVCWCVGVLVCWCVVLVCWCVGGLVGWCVGVLVCWCVGVLVCWLVCWCV